ncbi:MAG: FAD-binding protein [Eggerthellaceae bacterium]|nr:FAD-binding protein [Eggerthellaceae bacterium]
MTEKLTRRGFLGGAAITAASMGALALAGCNSSTGNGGDNAASIDWDYEADVVVVGYGGAGVSAAIGAAQGGASAIVVEKAPEGLEGGNTSVSGGGFITIDSNRLPEVHDYIKMQGPGTLTDDEVAGFVHDLDTLPAWLKDLGAEVALTVELKGGLYPFFPGADAVKDVSSIGGNGNKLFNFLKDKAESMAGVRVLYETAGYRLIYEPKTKEVYGVIALQGDQKINIKAKKGVVLALGGYENNIDMIWQYNAPTVPVWAYGTPYNTGDGFPMLSDVGGKVRHFASVEWGSYCFARASEEAGTAVAMVYRSPQFEHSILVNPEGKRFKDEVSKIADTPAAPPTPCHDKRALAEFDLDTFDRVAYKNFPMHMIFDETRRAGEPLAGLAVSDSGQTWCGIHGTYRWSEDNLGEVEKGYILKADSIEELASKVGIDPAGLVAEVEHWNAMCEAGVDTDFGRERQLTPIETPPFYAVELAMCYINTQGGPDRNGKLQVLDWNGDAIPRLYAGGEFGSIYGWLYQGAGNVPEAMAARTAGANAATLDPWE